MFNSKEPFSSLIATPSLKVCTGDTASTISTKGIGTVTITCNDKVLSLKNCLYVPNLNCNLITITKKHSEWKLDPSGAEGVVISRHVVFDKSTFPSLENLTTNHNSALIIPEHQKTVAEEVDEVLPADLGLVDEFLPIEPDSDDSSRMVDEIQESNKAGSAEHSQAHPVSARPRALLSAHNDAPRTSKQAINSLNKDSWSKAIEKELALMNQLQVWDVVDLKPEYKLVGTTWVFRTKQDHLKKVIEHKACLCAQGFTQTPGLYFAKTYAPTGRMNLLQTLIAFAASKNLSFHQINIKSGFLNAPLAEKV
ncbi:hypothetical protein O181_080994 [Austropuccinia psidii MF-1]|uniref:Reverse transcriptase Ty1/copia-type domain-containing protein n=1 Tax=Austropuccinia psidii MF-1 TaxID=1389203 RepID=A0A9Q3FLZ5_9BASI|nr:hypothetical protein [Austropuccinia psidii MF-1]